jgi:S-layer protein
MSAPTTYSTVVQELYVAYFGRPADYFGLQNFEAALSAAGAPTDLVHLAAAYESNAAVKTLVDTFGKSTESQTLFGTIGASATSADNFVNAIFENLFGRAANNAGLNFWSNAITSGTLTPSDAALAIAAGAAINTTAQGLIDAATMANKVAVATTFTSDLGTSSLYIVAYSGSSAGNAARALLTGVSATTDLAAYTDTINNTIATLVGEGPWPINLTTGADNIVTTQTKAVFNAVIDNAAGLAAGGQPATLNAGDSISASTQPGSSNALQLADFGIGSDFALPQQVTLTGITTLKIESLEAVAAPDQPNGSYDFSHWSGLTSIEVKASTGNDILTAPDAATVNVSDTAGSVTVYGGSRISATTDAASTIAIHGGAATVAVNLIGGDNNSITDQNFGRGSNNTISGVVLTDSGNTIINSDALSSLSLGGNNDVTVNAATATRMLVVQLAQSANSAAIATVVDATATTLDVVASGPDTVTEKLNLQTASAGTLRFDDAAGMQLTGLFAPLATSITISGNGAFAADLSQINSTANIDATGAIGVNAITLAFGAGADGNVGFGSHTAADQVTIGAMAAGGATPNLAHLLTIAGLNNAAQDSIVFADGAGTGGASFQQISSAQVAASGGTATSLAGWIATATGLGGIVQQSAHGVLEFQFGGNTYLIETATATDGGTISAHDSIVELVGSGYTFAHTGAINGGVLHLAGK